MAIPRCTEANDRSGRSVPGKHDASAARRPVPASAHANPLHPLLLRQWLSRLLQCSQHQTTRFPLRELENDRVKLTESPALHTSTSTATHAHPDEHWRCAPEHGFQLEGIVRWQRVLRGTGDEGKTYRAVVGVLGRLGAGREGARLSTGAGHVRVNAFARHREPM